MKASVDVAPGQSWAIRDDRYEGWRYVTVEQVDNRYAYVKPTRGARRSRIQLTSFHRSRFSMCGHDGAGVLPAYTGSVANGCLSCPPKPRTLPLEYNLSVGSGMVTVIRDDTRVWSCHAWTNKRVAHFELKARETPGDWRIRIDGMMSEEMYQRQPDGWVLVWRGFGFA